MRGMGRGRTGEGRFTSSPMELLLIFLFKAVIPLLPIVGIFWLAALIMDAEITGSYRGLSNPPIGELILNLQEDNDQLFGTLSIARRLRFQIEDGKMISDNKMQMSLRKTLPGTSISGVGARDAIKVVGETPMPKNLEGVESAAKVAGALLTMSATKTQNELNGNFALEGKTYTFTAQRSSLASFLGRRWINRTLAYFGFRFH